MRCAQSQIFWITCNILTNLLSFENPKHLEQFKFKKMKKKILVCSIFLAFSLPALFAQSPSEDLLFQQVMKLDSILFQEGFNKCNYEALEKITAKDLEFYHDQGGITSGKRAFIETIRRNICSINYKPIRKPVDGSFKVYPLKSNGKIYGAIQEGIHEFYAKEEGKETYLTSTARFTHLWIKQEDQWLLKRVLSYEHLSP